MIPILAGWTLALLVGAATHPANLPIAFVCGAVAAVLPFVAQLSVVTAKRDVEARKLSLLSASVALFRRDVNIAEEEARMHTATLYLGAWAFARGVSVWMTAAVPLLVLWRLGGAE